MIFFCCETTTIIDMAFRVFFFKFQDDQIVPVISELTASLLLVQLAINKLTDVSFITKNDHTGQGAHEK